MYKKILVPLDGSQLSEVALPHAEALAKSEEAELILLRVPIIPIGENFAHDPQVSETIRKEIEQEARQYINAKIQKVIKDHVRVSGMTREGPVPDTILEVAEETHADLIAMSTHGRTGISRWLLGSVADKIVHRAHIPVMLVHPN